MSTSGYQFTERERERERERGVSNDILIVIPHGMSIGPSNYFYYNPIASQWKADRCYILYKVDGVMYKTGVIQLPDFPHTHFHSFFTYSI